MTRFTPTHALGRLKDLWSDTSERIGLSLLGSGVFCLLLSAAIGLRLRSPFGHDESVYALKARELAHPGQMHVYQYWSAYRAPGFPAVLSLVFRVKESALAARGLVVLFSILTLWCVWAIGRKLVDPVTGGLAALLTAITPAFAAMSTFVLVDGPGAALSLLAILLFLPILQGRISWWRSAAVIVVCWAATTVRFGAPLCYGVGLGALGLVAVVRSLKDRDWRRILNVAVVGIGAVAAIPGLYSSQLFAVDGLSPKAANDALRGSKNLTVWTGWRDLRQWFVDEVMHNQLEYAFTIVVLIGVVAAVVLAVRRRELRLPLGFFLFCAVGGLVGLVVSVGLIVTNYLMIVMPFVALAAAVGFVGVSRLVAPRREFALVRARAARPARHRGIDGSLQGLPPHEPHRCGGAADGGAHHGGRARPQLHAHHVVLRADELVLELRRVQLPPTHPELHRVQGRADHRGRRLHVLDTRRPAGRVAGPHGTAHRGPRQAPTHRRTDRRRRTAQPACAVHAHEPRACHHPLATHAMFLHRHMPHPLGRR